MKESGVGSSSSSSRIIMFESKDEKEMEVCVTEGKKSHEESHESRSTAEKS
jgi:hypothetical protein